MQKLQSISIFFPALNDSKSLPFLIKSANVTAKRIAKDYEIIIVNDGSTDSTKQLVLSLQKKYKKLKLVNHIINKGYGQALSTGFKTSRKKWIFYTDGDGQYNPEELIKLVKKLDTKITVVNGYKIKRHDSFTRKVMGSMYNQILHFLFPLPISDVDCDFRLIKASLLQKIQLSSHSGLVCLELVLKLKEQGAQFAEVGVTHRKRKYGKSQFYTFMNLWETFKELIHFLKKYY